MAATVLVADDSVTIRKVVELTFMDQDYEVVEVDDGEEALAKLSEWRPDLVIADVHMPGADGYEVCQRSKELHPEVPVLLLVGSFEPFDAARARTAGADGRLDKPFNARDLLALVQTWIHGAPDAPSAEAVDRAAMRMQDRSAPVLPILLLALALLFLAAWLLVIPG